MNTLKKLIIGIIIAILILAIVILCIIQSSLDEVDSVTGNEVNYDDYQGEYEAENKKLQKVTTKRKYYSVKQIIDNYISYITNTEIGVEALEQVLAADYRNEFNITRDNIVASVSKFANNQIYIEDMYELEKSDNIDLVIVNGKTKSGSVEFNIIIKLDLVNDTFEIYPEEYFSKHGYSNLENVDIANVISENNINAKEYNVYNNKSISDLEMCKYYLEHYIYNVTSNVENAYNLLDEQYRTNRFGNIEVYRAYVNSNLDKIKNAQLKEYTVTKYEDYKQYVCIDNNGNYYLFRETAIMDYTLLLDTYTVVLPEFVEKYYDSTIQERVALNISNFIQAINDKNYNYAYKVLSANFKNNKFSTQADLKAYVQNNLFEKNTVEFEEYLIQGNIHIYNIVLSDSNSDNSNKISMTVIMELGSGTNFAMSFSIN